VAARVPAVEPPGIHFMKLRSSRKKFIVKFWTKFHQ
jgi:hypothetical protein